MSMPELATLHPVAMTLLIFFARILDVSLGTVRTIVVFRGRRLLAAVVGFFEIIIWVLAAGQVLQNLDDGYLIVAYAAGYGAGNYLGIWLEAKLALGREMVSAISFRADGGLARTLRERGFQAIDVDADAGRGPSVDLVLTITRRRRVPELIRTILETDPEAQYSVSDVKLAHEGFDPTMLSPRSHWGWRAVGKRK
ncbi:MAG: DUF2179 domain-containing protein [Gammaproteobacteria bacterium]